MTNALRLIITLKRLIWMFCDIMDTCALCERNDEYYNLATKQNECLSIKTFYRYVTRWLVTSE